MSEQNWNRPWTTEEFIKNAEKWSLAGDAALLNTIKHLGENLLSKSEDVSNSINKLLLSADELQVKLDIAQNEFHSLKNVQFIENRVQEEDETLDNTEEKKVPSEAVSAEVQSKMINDSILTGIKVMEKYYDNVEVSISDSEDETEISYVLKPKDLYVHRPLPPIIGSEEWDKKWYLEDASSESESDKVSETYSDTDSEDDLPKDLNKISDSSSELDFSSVTSEGRPVGSSTFNDSTKKTDFVPSSEESDANLESQSVKTPVTNKNFASELAAKLGTVISQHEELHPEEVNTKPIQPLKNNNYISHIFSDEPPPLDQFEDRTSVGNIHTDLFSGGEGLFDDSEDDFWEPKKPDTTKFQEKVDKVPDIRTPLKSAKNIFDEEDDEDMFQSSLKKPEIKIPGSTPKGEPKTDINDNQQAKKTGIGLFDDEKEEENIFSTVPHKPPSKMADVLFGNSTPPDEPTIISTNNARKKPVGGVSVFASADLFGGQNINDILSNRQKQTKSKPSEKPAPAVEESKISQTMSANEISILSNEKPEVPLGKPTVAPEKPKLFDSSPDDVDATSHARPVAGKLFGADDIGNEFHTEPTSSTKVDIFGDDDLFTGISSNRSNASKIAVVSKIESIQESTNKNKKHDIFDDLFTDTSSKAANLISNLNKKPSLFDDDDLAKYDLFADIPKDDDDVENLISTTSKILDESKTLISKTIRKENTIASDSKKMEVVNTPPEDTHRHKVESLSFESSTPTDAGNIDGVEESKTDILGVAVNMPISQKIEFGSDVKKEKLENEFKAVGSKQFINSIEDLDDSEVVPSNDSKNRIEDIDEPKVEERKEFVNIIKDVSEMADQPKTQGDTKRNDIASGVTKTENSSYEVQSAIKTEKNLLDGCDIFSQNFTKPPDLLDDLAEKNIFADDLKPSNSVVPDVNESLVPPQPHIPKAEPKSFFGLFDCTPPTDDEADWDTKSENFSDSEDLASYPTIKDEKRSVFDNEPPLLEPPPLDENSDESTKSVEIIDTISEPLPVTLNTPSMNNSKDIRDQAVVESAVKGTNGKSIGSVNNLKQNLNINVNALRPGFAPPKFGELSMPSKVIQPADMINDNSAQKVLPTSTSSLPILTGKTNEGGVSFEDGLDHHEVLHSYTKNRAKIPLKRKPSTRRGRQEALKRAATDDLSDTEPMLEHNPLQRSVSEGTDFSIDSILTKPHITSPMNPESVLKSSIIDQNKDHQMQPEVERTQTKYNSASKHDTDLNNVTDNITLPLSPEKPMKSSEERPSACNIFEQRGNEDRLFSTNILKIPSAKPKAALFESSDSEEDLFGKNDTKKIKAKKRVSKVPSKKGLFDDTSSEDDLFASSSKK